MVILVQSPGTSARGQEGWTRLKWELWECWEMKQKKSPPSACFCPHCASLGTGFMISSPFFGVNLLPCATPVNELRFSSLTLAVTSEHKVITYYFSAHPASSHSRQAKLTGFGAGFLRGFVSSQWHCSSPGDKVLSPWGSPGVVSSQ